jgi:hypothetical protein
MNGTKIVCDGLNMAIVKYLMGTAIYWPSQRKYQHTQQHKNEIQKYPPYPHT